MKLPGIQWNLDNLRFLSYGQFLKRSLSKTGHFRKRVIFEPVIFGNRSSLETGHLSENGYFRKTYESDLIYKFVQNTSNFRFLRYFEGKLLLNVYFV